MIYAILEQSQSRGGGNAIVLSYSFDRETAIKEMAKQVAKALENFAILDLKLYVNKPENVLLAAPEKDHGVTIEFTIVEVEEIQKT